MQTGPSHPRPTGSPDLLGSGRTPRLHSPRPLLFHGRVSRRPLPLALASALTCLMNAIRCVRARNRQCAHRCIRADTLAVHVKRCAVNLIWVLALRTERRAFKLFLCCSVAHDHGLYLLHRISGRRCCSLSQSGPTYRHPASHTPLILPRAQLHMPISPGFVSGKVGHRTHYFLPFTKLRHNLHAIKFTLIKCTIQWCLVYSHIHAYHHNLTPEPLYYPIKNAVPISSHFLSPPANH